MADLKVTLAQRAPQHSPNILAKADWLAEEKRLYWSLRGKPSRDLRQGWVYFIREGYVAGRARIVNVVTAKKDLYSYAGSRIKPTQWSVEYKAPLELARGHVHHRGFQGVRYVGEDEQDRFEKAFQSNAERTDNKNIIKSETEEDEFVEGKLVFREHHSRERNATLARRVKRVRLENTGKLVCEACGFDFAKTYGELASGYIECHHNFPLSSYRRTRKTRLQDLSLVCSNCHRAIHRSKTWMSIAELATLISQHNERRKHR